MDPTARRAEPADRRLSGHWARCCINALGGLSHPEASAILGVAAKTIETQVYSAKMILAARVGTEMRSSSAD
jgi:hypothetical protein